MPPIRRLIVEPSSESDDSDATVKRSETMSSGAQNSPRATARKSTGSQLTPEKNRDSRSKALLQRASSQKSSRNLQPSTSFAVTDSDISDFEEIPPGRSFARQNPTVNRQASTSTAISTFTMPESDSSDSDITTVTTSTPVRTSPRTRSKANNAPRNQATSKRNTVLNTRASTSNRKSTSDSEEEEEVSDDNNSRRQSLRTSQRSAGQSTQYEGNISDCTPETPDSDDDVPLHNSPANQKRPAAHSKRRQVGRRKKHSTSSSSDEENVSRPTSKKQTFQAKSNASSKNQSSVKQNIDVVDMSTVKNLARKCVYFLLIEDQNKHSIKKKSIVTNVFKDQSFSPKVYKEMLKEVNTILQETYGLELIKVENQKDSYLIINILEKELGIEDFYDFSKSKQEHYGLVLYLLTVIFMNENSITETELWKALKPLGIDPSSQKLHPLFGDVKKYITSELVKQMYLECRTLNTDGGEREFVWGVRAKSEIDKSDLLNFTCEVMNVSSPEQWVLQYRDAQESARQEMNDDD